MKLIVIGGGIGGLALSIALEKVGIEATIFEQAEELREAGVGVTLWHNALKVLRELGLESKVKSEGSSIKKMYLKNWQGKIFDMVPIQAWGERLGSETICLTRPVLLKTLAEAIQKEKIVCSKRFVSCEQNGKQITAFFSDGSHVVADGLVGADGIFSVVRSYLLNTNREMQSQLLAPEFFKEKKPRYAGYTCWRGLANFSHPSFEEGVAAEYWGRGCRFAVLPCGKDLVFWYATKNSPEGTIKNPVGGKEEIVPDFASWESPIPEIIAATSNTDILRNDIIDRKPIKCWGRGLFTLLGDAAHPTTPNLGQGACQALEDAVVLADSLRKEQDVIKGMRCYEHLRFPRTAWITKTSRQIGQIGQLQKASHCFLRDFFARTKWTQMYSLKQFYAAVDYSPPSLKKIA